jgi:hypothetical protein
MFSLFADHSQNTPIRSLTLSELHRQLVAPSCEPFTSTINMIERLRATTDKAEQKAYKDKLPPFTAGAEVSSKAAPKQGETDTRIIKPSGFMQVDIDLQDNPNMKDPEAVRRWLANVPYIALAAISARGQGVWGLIALKEPNKALEYPAQIHEYFRKAGVTLDKSKGKSLTELRYFAPDPGAILNTDYTLMPLLPKPAPKPSHHTQATGSTLQELVKWVNNTTGYYLQDGQKHYFIYWLSYAIRKNGATEGEVYNTIYGSILSQDQIKSNCIQGGIKHANDKGIYVPTPQQSTFTSKVMQPQAQTPPMPPQYMPLPIPEIEMRTVIGTDGMLTIQYPFD